MRISRMKATRAAKSFPETGKRLDVVRKIQDLREADFRLATANHTASRMSRDLPGVRDVVRHEGDTLAKDGRQTERVTPEPVNAAVPWLV